MKIEKLIVAAVFTLFAGTLSATALADQNGSASHEAQSDNSSKPTPPPPPSNQNDDGMRPVPQPQFPDAPVLPSVPDTDD